MDERFVLSGRRDLEARRLREMATVGVAVAALAAGATAAGCGGSQKGAEGSTHAPAASALTRADTTTAKDYFRRVWSNDLENTTRLAGFTHKVSGAAECQRQIAKLVDEWKRGFPDLRMEITGVRVEKGSVVVQWKAQGTHQGAIAGIAPTGKEVQASGRTVYSFVDGRIIGERYDWDAQALLDQLRA